MNWTEQGIKDVKNMPEKVAGVRGQLGAMDVEITSMHVTMGRYDIVAVIQTPSAETASSALLTIGGQGNVRTETLTAFPFPEFVSDILPKVE
jgi:uncharacterized protein with GYD domain